MVWAFVGGLLLDVMLPERPIGSTTLALLISVGLALRRRARRREPPPGRSSALTAFGITFLYQALLTALLALASGVDIGALSLGSCGRWSRSRRGVIAVTAAWVIRSLLLRFGTFERVDW